MSSQRERNDRKSAFRGPRRRRESAGSASDPASWIWGWHAVEAALLNPARLEVGRLLTSSERADRLAALRPGLTIERCESADVARMLPPGAVHQGVALKIPALEGVELLELAEPARGVLIMLDQVTDPQNVGGIFRSAAAFGARGVILQDRHAPQLGGALAKASAGAIDKVPAARVVNLARALDTLSDLGWIIVGLAGDGGAPVREALDQRPTVLVMGSEGEGMRRLISEHCDVLARIPMPGGFESLNVATAAAVALYEASQAQHPRVRGEPG